VTKAQSKSIFSRRNRLSIVVAIAVKTFSNKSQHYSFSEAPKISVENGGKINEIL